MRDKGLFLFTRFVGTILLLIPLPHWDDGLAIGPRTNTEALLDLSARSAAEAEARRTPLYHELLKQSVGPQGRLNANRDISLVGIDPRGFPIYYTTDNLVAAQSIATDQVWPGGPSGLDLSGSNEPRSLALWDGGAVRTSHQEFGSRVEVRDGTGEISYHTAHVAGTMVAAGVDPNAKGMSYSAFLDSYDWDDDTSEMAAAAADGLRVSNHSYSEIRG
jgi:hypothetical protein